jgi:YHS domain-containing protein
MKLLSPLYITLSVVLASLSLGFGQDKNAKCPIMTDDDADPEYTVEFEGKKVLLCCEKCTKIWHGSEKYIIKLVPDLLPQFKGMEAQLGLDKVELLKQKYCPIRKDQIVTPAGPTADYKGTKVYFANKKSLEKWNADVEGSAKKAIAAGLLPQLEPAK